MQLDGSRLRRVREDLELSQAEFAGLIRQAGREFGEPNACTKRLVQKWELGEHATCRSNYRRALERVTGLSFMQLCVRPAKQPNPNTAGDVSALARLDQVIAELGTIRARLGVDRWEG
jgi:transcriptional regulator with XRE-family HTH domain